MKKPALVALAIAQFVMVLDQSVMIVRYVRLAFWPQGLVLDYGEPLRVSFGEVAPYVFAVAALATASAVALVRNVPSGFLGAWFFLTLAPTSSIVPISTEVGAHGDDVVERSRECRLYQILQQGILSMLPSLCALSIPSCNDLSCSYLSIHA